MTLWTCIARCGVCKKELNRAVHVAPDRRPTVALAAQFMAICDTVHHNVYSDCNTRVELEWLEEDPETGKPKEEVDDAMATG